MLKVICINDSKWHNASRCPAFGEICTVENAIISPFSNTPVYTLVEYPPIPPSTRRLFSQDYFLPLSDIDETELVNEKEYAG
jgi:hypothetical protein